MKKDYYYFGHDHKFIKIQDVEAGDKLVANDTFPFFEDGKAYEVKQMKRKKLHEGKYLYVEIEGDRIRYLEGQISGPISEPSKQFLVGFSEHIKAD